MAPNLHTMSSINVQFSTSLVLLDLSMMAENTETAAKANSEEIRAQDGNSVDCEAALKELYDKVVTKRKSVVQVANVRLDIAVDGFPVDPESANAIEKQFEKLRCNLAELKDEIERLKTTVCRLLKENVNMRVKLGENYDPAVNEGTSDGTASV